MQVYKQAVFCSLLLLTGCGGSKNKNHSTVVGLKADFEEREHSVLLSGMSKRRATSHLFLQELGASCMDIPILIDAYELKKHTVDKSAILDKEKKIHTDEHVCLHSADGCSDKHSPAHIENNMLPHRTPADIEPSVEVLLDIQLSYKSNKSIVEIVDFYMCQMEGLGWHFSTDFQAEEIFLFFVKPDKRSVISIRPYKKSVYILICVSNRMC